MISIGAAINPLKSFENMIQYAVLLNKWSNLNALKLEEDNGTKLPFQSKHQPHALALVLDGHKCTPAISLLIMQKAGIIDNVLKYIVQSWIVKSLETL